MSILSSSKLLWFTSTISVTALLACWHLHSLRLAPTLPGVDWREQGQTVLIAYRSDKGCGCTDTIGGYIADALDAHQKVVIVGESKQLRLLETFYGSKPGITYVTDSPNALPQPFRSTKTKALLVEDGYLSNLPSRNQL